MATARLTCSAAKCSGVLPPCPPPDKPRLPLSKGTEWLHAVFAALDLR